MANSERLFSFVALEQHSERNRARNCSSMSIIGIISSTAAIPIWYHLNLTEIFAVDNDTASPTSAISSQGLWLLFRD